MPETLTHDYAQLRDAVVLLLAAVTVVPLFKGFGVNSVIGYLVAGVAIGPHGFALVGDLEGTHRLAELGIVFMLFAIGLELSVERLRVMARYVFGFGVAQVAVTGGVLFGAAMLIGAGWEQAAVIGGALALSSTAFVLQLLSERGELSTHFGRVILSVLLLQDLAVVPGLAVVTALGGAPDELVPALLLAGLKAVAALGVLILAGRFVLRPLYRMIANTHSPELFAAATLLVVLATAWGTAEAGLSMALGAFLAGLMLAGTEYRHQIEADIRPVRGILMGLFFISIGMLMDMRVILPRLPEILAVTAGLISVKALIILLTGRLLGLPLSVAANAGLHLSQGGEFAFVLFSLAMGTAVLPVETGQFLLAVAAISMALTPLLAAAGRRAQGWLDHRGVAGADTLAAEAEQYSGHVVIAGFGRVGKTIAEMLDERGFKWIAVDRHAANVADARARGLPVFFGDAANDAIMQAARTDHARAAVVTLDDPTAAGAVLRGIRKTLPDLPVIVRARDTSNMKDLLRSGASSVLPETVESSLLLGGAVLRSLGEDDAQVDQAIEAIKRATYQKAEPRGDA
ncbi:monovalent cation:proton antiporter-2 (CPA2) family protein [Mesorhizobium sp. ZMM04-5]|uniref:Monovalent cation:proton antiporter-2 (CPA2) family protein n=1 Tax=Mesorhizobium marinum TaxID=3228790 RepID=A0ABV3R4J5_9HYPH